MVSYKPQDDRHDPGQHHPDELHSHAVPLWILFAVFGALVFLTFLTVFFAHPFVKEHIRIFVNEHFYNMTAAEVSRFGLMLAMGIATLKAALVVLYFMHLRWDRPFNAIVFIGTLGFVALFVGYTLADATAYTRAESSIRTDMDRRHAQERVQQQIEARREARRLAREAELERQQEQRDRDAREADRDAPPAEADNGDEPVGDTEEANE